MTSSQTEIVRVRRPIRFAGAPTRGTIAPKISKPIDHADLKPGHWIWLDGKSWMVITVLPNHCEAYAARIKAGEIEQVYIGSSAIERAQLRDSRRPWIIHQLGRRADGHDFIGFVEPSGRQYLLSAGCQDFACFETATKHWQTRSRAFLTERRNKQLNRWSVQRVRDFHHIVQQTRKKA